jgi:hypothetical protein
MIVGTLLCVFYLPEIFTKKFSIVTDGESVKVNEFRRKDNLVSNNTYMIASNPHYEFRYFVPDNHFQGTIINDDYITARKKFEQDFLKILGINKSEACKLNVSLYMPFVRDQQLSKIIDFGLSFCPDGIPFNQTQTNGGQTDNSNSSQSTSLLQKLLNVFKNPLTVALGAAFVIVAGIILFARR